MASMVAAPPPGRGDADGRAAGGSSHGAGVGAVSGRAAAEDRAAWELMACFDDEWTLFLGYADRRGEVDLVTTGPAGCGAIEVKGRGVRVHVDAEDWTFEKFDRYGNLVEYGVLHDRGGRSWGRQVTDVARELETFLRERNAVVVVHTAVVLIHERAEIDACQRLRVNSLHVGTDHLIEQVRSAPTVLHAQQRAKVDRLIGQVHTFHHQRRRR
ncbi:hypothetical protein ACTG9Q_28575 [Actinokineospora sp. 24-640]